jgi:hypothetical protein
MKTRGSLFYLSAALALGLLIAGGAAPGFATINLKEAASASKPEDLQEVGKQLNNPVSSIWNITTQSDMTFLKGNLSPAYRGQFTFNFQPVLPMPLTSKWNLIPRPVISILTSPFISGFDPLTRSAEWSRTGGIGDIAFVTFLSPNWRKVIFGFGPTFIFPTATSYNLGQGEVQVGPAVVLGFLTEKWVGLVFPQNWWSVAGTPRKAAVNQMNLQYVLVRMLPGAWQIQMTPNILINWNADRLGNAVTFPLGIGVGRTLRINPGLPPVSMALEFQWMPVYPQDFGQRFNIRFTFKPVLPNLVKKPLLGS